NDIEPDAAPALLGERLGRGYARLEDQVDGLFLGELGVGIKPATRHSCRADALRVNASAIVAHRDDDLTAFVGGGDGGVADRCLASGLAYIGTLDAVVHGVAHEVQQG